MTNRKKIMIIDDNEDLLEVMKESLNHEFEVFIFSRAEHALAELESIQPAAIISDYHMPGMNGTELTQKLRILGVQAPVIFVTGQSNKELLLSAIRLGASDVLEKPVEEKELEKAIYRALEIDKRKAAGDKKTVGLLQVTASRKIS